MFEEEQLIKGYEGIIMRAPESRYKQGRGTWREGIIYKLKRFEDFEMKIVGFEEQMTNTNEDIRSFIGTAKRSSAKEGKIPANTLGTLIGEYTSEHFGTISVTAGCGTMKHEERKFVWDHKELFIGNYATIRHFPHGAKDSPRQPRFNSWRNKLDFTLLYE